MERIYLDSAATNLVNPRVLDVAAKFTDMLGDKAHTTSDVFRMQKESLGTARETMANFLGCDKSEIALMQSTSHALGTFSNCLPLKKGDNVLICDLEYQASIVCWQTRVEEVGFELREVKTTGGRITVDDFRKNMDENTKVILLAAVQEINGFRADVKEIGKLAKEYGCYYIVDGIQEAGALKVDVKDIGMDFYCAGGKKWLGNPFGMGFLYIRKELLGRIKPMYYSYYDILVPERFGDYMDYLEDPIRRPFDDYQIVKDASVFEIGGHGNFLGAMALTEAIHVLEDIGIEKIQAHNIALNKYLYEGLSKLGLCMESPGDENNMSSIIVFNFDHLKNNNVEKERRLLHYLREKDIFVTVRCSTGLGGVRVSVHHYTTEDEVNIFLQAVRNFIEVDQASQRLSTSE
jgi:cysteine desulfurase/selenocysteine lyase